MSNSTTSNNQTTTSVTPARFTKEEKTVLYDLFQQNEDVIDIKHRRNSTKKNCSIRECWEKIAEKYNNHPETTTVRNVKQIQKFWLNARLRKHYPLNTSGDSATSANNKLSTKQLTKQIKKFETINVIESNIKFEKECDSEDIEMIQDDDDDDDNNMQQEIEISTSSNDVLLESTEPTTHQYNIDIDHISAEKLTLNDLLEFKNARSTRPGDEIVLQIKTPNSDSITSSSLHHHHHHHQKDNNTSIVDNSPVQTYTTTSYRIPNSVLSDEQYQTAPTIIQQQQTIQHQQTPLNHKTTTGQQNCCSHNINNNNTTSTNSIDNSPEETINFYRVKEAELKYKEEQLKLEQTKIELAQAKEVLKHMRELHCYQIEEMKIKLRLLYAEERKLSTTVKGNGSVVTIKKLQH